MKLKRALPWNSALFRCKNNKKPNMTTRRTTKNNNIASKKSATSISKDKVEESKARCWEILAVTIKSERMNHNLIVKKTRKNLWQTITSLSNSRCLITTVSRTKDEVNSNSKIQKMMSKIVTTMMKRKERKRARRKKIQMMRTTSIPHIIDFLAVSTLRHRATIANLTRPWRSNTGAKRLSKGAKMAC